MNPTKLLYLEDFTTLAGTATVADVINEEGWDVVVLDQTILYPQGGGQPYDQGIIQSPTAKFLVEEVRFVDGIVKHIGKFENGSFNKGDAISLTVNEERRRLNSRLHSAGHVVDLAVTNLKLGWIPGKGFHFPQGPYVEYVGNLDGVDTEKLKADIENLCNQYIAEGRQTKAVFMEKEKMKEVCNFVPDYIPEGKPGRVVMFGGFGVPCGGTHVINLSEIKGITIRKVKQDGLNIRLGYDVIPLN